MLIVREAWLGVTPLVRFGDTSLWKQGLTFKMVWIALQCGAILLLSVALPLAYKVLPASLARLAPQAEVLTVAYMLAGSVLAWSCVTTAKAWLRLRRSRDVGVSR